MDGELWQWVSYEDPCWFWPAWEAVDRFQDHEAYCDALFTLAVRECLKNLGAAFPERRLLRLANELHRAVEEVQADLVAELRSQGISWTRIGTALEVGRTAAQKRYRRGLRQARQDQLEQEAKAAMAWAAGAIAKGNNDDSAVPREFLDRIHKRRMTR
jgi:predicted transcriptional regulator